MPDRVCPYCGKPISVLLDRCPYCREDVPRAATPGLGPVPARAPSPSNPRGNIRRGLLWALLAGVLYYFASGSGPLKIPVPIPDFISQLLLNILIPLVFLAGVAMALYGLFQSLRR